jgi:hypothetical protein
MAKTAVSWIVPVLKSYSFFFYFCQWDKTESHGTVASNGHIVPRVVTDEYGVFVTWYLHTGSKPTPVQQTSNKKEAFNDTASY